MGGLWLHVYFLADFDVVWPISNLSGRYQTCVGNSGNEMVSMFHITSQVQRAGGKKIWRKV